MRTAEEALIMLKARRDEIKLQLRYLEGMADGLTEAMRIVDNGIAAMAVAAPIDRRSAMRGTLKASVIDALTAAGDVGATVTDVMECAAKAGVILNRQSVSPLLSRMKADGVVSCNGGRYMFKQRELA